MQQQMDPLVMAMLARRQQQDGGAEFGGGPQLVAPAQQQSSAQIGLQGAPQANGGAGMSALGNGLTEAAKIYRQQELAKEQAAQAARQQQMAQALAGGFNPGTGPGGMGSMSFGGPR